MAAFVKHNVVLNPHKVPSPLQSLCAVRHSRKRLYRTPSAQMQSSALNAPEESPLSYASAGVDIDVESASVRALISALSGTKPRLSGERGAIVDHAGGFSGLIEFGDNLLALCTDGVGSKLLLAAELQYYESIALDCMAMNVNDLLCIGAEPLAFVDYIAAPKPNPQIWAALGRSLATACKRARVSLSGGETASLPDMVSHIDMSGTALGWLPRGAQLDGTAVSPGDKIIGLPSSGIHSNGYSLARRILEKSGLSLQDEAPFDLIAPRADGDIWRHGDSEKPHTLGEVLLNPTKIYVDPVVDLLLACRSGSGPCEYDAIHGIAHITGGGLSNLLRLNSNAGFHIANPLPVLPEFLWMQRVGDIASREMYRTFNMGMGLSIVVDANAAQAVVEWLAERLTGSLIVGEVNASGRVTHAIAGVEFDEY